MSTKFSERLIILRDMQKGLMLKTTGIKNKLQGIVTRPKCMEEPDLARIRKTLEKSFPEIAAIERVQGFDKFQDISSRTALELEPIYEHFTDIVQWREQALALLVECPNEVIEFKFDKNPSLISGVMDLLVGYVKLMLYWSSIPDHRVLLSMYVRAYQCLNGRADRDLSHIGLFVVNYENPMRIMVDDFSPISMQVGNLLSSLLPWMTEILNANGLRLKDTFNPLAEPAKMGMPSYKKVYTDLLYGDRFNSWVLFGFLVCPSELVTAGGYAVFKLAAESGFILQVHEEVVLPFHDLIEALFLWFPQKGQPQFSKDVKVKKLAMELCKTAVINSGKQHREMRAYLRERLTVLRELLLQFPGLVAPKLPMVLAGISRARSEVEWYVVHQGQHPPKKRLKHYHEIDYHDFDVGALLFVLDELTQLVRNNRAAIQSYYIEYLKGAHYSALESLVQQVLGGHNGTITTTAQGVLNGFAAQLDALDASDTAAIDLQPLRLNWSRLSEAFTTTRFNATNVPGMTDLMGRMNTISHHSRFVDDLDGLLVQFAELHRVYNFRAAFETMFQQVLTGAEQQPRYVSAFVRFAAHGLNNVHRMCPDDQIMVGDECTRRAAGYLTAICTRLHETIQPLCQQLELFEQQTSPMEAAYRLQRAQEAKRAWRSAGVHVQAEALPGFESRPWNRVTIQPLVQPDRAVALLCWSMARCGDVHVYETCFSPVDWVREKLTNSFRSFVRDLITAGNDTTEGAGPTMQRPSVLLNRVMHFCAAMQRATQHIGIDLSRVMRTVLYTETFSKELSGVGRPVPPNSNSGLGDSFLKHLVNWYVMMCDSLPPVGGIPPGVVYSPFTRGFVRVLGVAPRGALPAELFADERELDALALLLGPAGVRVMEGAILERVVLRVGGVKTFLHMQLGKLVEFRDALRVRDPSAWTKAGNKLGGATDALMGDLIGVGILLTFRRALKAALRRVSHDRVPFLSTMVASVQSACEENTSSRPALVPVDCLANDVGLDVGAADQSLKAALAQFKTTAEDVAEWDVLPHAVAAAFYDSSIWRRTTYLESVDAFASNEHLLGPAVQSLTFVFQSVVIERPSGMEPQATIAQSLQSFVVSTATVLLRMKARQRENGFKDLPLRAMLVLLEKFVESCPYMSNSTLQRVVPYEMMHAAYVDMGLGRFRGAEEGQTVSSAIASAEHNVAEGVEGGE